MLGAIIGDIIGSAYECNNVKRKDFPFFSNMTDFTDDTVLTVAVADRILNGGTYLEAYKHYGRKYPDAGYGGHFYKWLMNDQAQPYLSFGNGSAMRVSPVGFAYNTLEEVLEEAKKSAMVTHNHPEGIKGAQAVASSIFLARTGRSREAIRDFIEDTFGYNLHRTIDEIRPSYRFDASCQGSVPEAIIAFMESKDFEDAIRTAISLGGDSDTIACITGGVAQAFYRILPGELVKQAFNYLQDEFISVINDFSNKFGVKYEAP